MDSMKTRDKIVEKADQLFYQQGFERTSFSDIADAVQISRGNFYHHFKSKDAILDAVIETRLADRQKMLHQWEIDGETPEDRIRSFIHILILNRSKIKRYGCPVGTLCVELAKMNHPMRRYANEILTLFRTWLSRQFTLLGCKDDADELALHVLAHSQGVATIANAYQDDKFVQGEVDRICSWLKSYPTIIRRSDSEEK